MKTCKYPLAWMAIFLSCYVHQAAAQSGNGTQTAWSNTPVTPDLEITDPVLRRGKAVYESLCLTCHDAIPDDADPQGMPAMTGTQSLRVKYRGEIPAVLDQRTDLTPEYVTTIVRNGSNVMAALRPTEISDEDLAAIGAYLSRKKP